MMTLMISVRSTYHELAGRGSVEFVIPHPLWYSYHTHKRAREKGCLPSLSLFPCPALILATRLT